MKTGVHEVSHALLYDREVMDAKGFKKTGIKPKKWKQSIAHIVCKSIWSGYSGIPLPILPAGAARYEHSGIYGYHPEKHLQKSLRISRHDTEQRKDQPTPIRKI